MKSKIIYYSGRVDIALSIAAGIILFIILGYYPFEKRLFPGISMYDLLTIASTEAILCMLIIVRVHTIIWSFLIDEEKNREFQEGAEAELEEYRERMEIRQFRKLVEKLVHKKVREHFGIPDLNVVTYL